MVLQQAFVKDIIDLRKICIDAYARNFHNHWNENGLEWYLDREFSIKRLTSDLNCDKTEYYFIKQDLKVVGFLKIRKHHIEDLPPEKTVELEKIYVLPQYKGKGIGKLALLEVIRMSTESALEYLFLGVIETNAGAISFYKKLGFLMHSKTTLDLPFFKDELKGMNRMVKRLDLASL